ncbi:hypothetical protein [Methylocystis sp.]|uniref:hypothetical protein n=1 Tax=Methylocystis sp. TaxID=1911079 RepID=UPI0025DA2F67|nr:hypothetical protein [Methylocystis sp.]
MSRLPPFDVVVWVKKTDDFLELRDALIGLAVTEPDESTDYQGMVDFHWGFETYAEADSLAAPFAMLRERPEIALLRLSNLENPSASFTFKDARHVRN